MPEADNYFFPAIVSLYFASQWAQAKGCLVGNDKFIKLAPKIKVSLYWFWANSFLKLNFERMPLVVAGQYRLHPDHKLQKKQQFSLYFSKMKMEIFGDLEYEQGRSCSVNHE